MTPVVTDDPGPGRRCGKDGCQGHIQEDGYCDTCGHRANTGSDEADSRSGSTGSPPTGSSGSSSGRTTTGPTGRGTGRLGEGLGRVPPEPGIDDPEGAVLKDPTLEERRRFCGVCGHPVGRGRGGQPGRLKGYCAEDGTPFDFEPKLRAGELVGGQYEIVGCLAHGGLGWIYLARDRAVGTWVVLKGLLNAGDLSAREVAKAEKDALAQTHHPNIVEIYNFVPHDGAEYIVMEYVNGLSLKQKLDLRREENGGHPDPFPVDQAIDYILAVLPAFSYLHDRNLVYCDFKLDNVIQVGDRVKLIDLGAVRRFDDTSGDSFGTRGFQAPEIAEKGVSVPSDLYTVGRTLAVLSLDFPYQKKFEFELPDPADHPALVEFDSFRRFLVKATAKRPSKRFQSATEMREQLLGVLHEVVALGTGQPQPSPPAAFGLPPDDEALPAAAINPADPAATFLANLSADDPSAVIEEIDDAVAGGQVVDSVELRLRRARALIDAGQHDAARVQIHGVKGPGAKGWRVAWLDGINRLATGSASEAIRAFDHCLSEVPGELAPKLGAALALEQTGDVDRAAELYSVVTTVDPSYVAAAKGLARCRERQGKIEMAIGAYDAIPRTHRAYGAAQVDAFTTLIGAGWYQNAGERLDQLGVDQFRRAELEVTLLGAALSRLTSGELSPSEVVSVGGPPLDERRLRLGLEAALRRLARFTSDPDERCEIIDRANRDRPVTLL